jgi:hypothetical protein
VLWQVHPHGDQNKRPRAVFALSGGLRNVKSLYARGIGSRAAREELVDLRVDEPGQAIYVRQRLAIGVETEAEAVADRGDADRESVLIGERHDWVGLAERAAEHPQLLARPREKEKPPAPKPQRAG